jgi:hypothetical protein
VVDHEEAVLDQRGSHELVRVGAVDELEVDDVPALAEGDVVGVMPRGLPEVLGEFQEPSGALGGAPAHQ